MRPETLAIHAGQRNDPASGSVVTPIHQTSGFQFDNAQHAADLFALDQAGSIYSRISNPTIDQFEARMTALDGGVGAVAVASGMTAVSYAVMNLCKAGDNFVTSPNLYGGVSNLFKNIMKDCGIEARFVEHDDPANFANAADDKTKLFFGEMLPNPRLNVFPVGEVAAFADAVGVPLIIDNTCATPILTKPFKHGAHMSVYSATKYICGHGSSIGGIIVDSGKFDWAKYADRFPDMNAPDDSLNGIKWAEKFGDMAYIVKLRATMLRDFGGCTTPFNAFLFNQGLETLSLRMEKHCENALKVAEYLDAHDKVNLVNYPKLASGKTREWADKYMGGYYGPMVGAEVKGGTEAGQKVVESLKLFYHVANIGDVRSMAIHPASTTHSQVPSDVRAKGGITDGYVRLCIGIEHIDDIIADLDQALALI